MDRVPPVGLAGAGRRLWSAVWSVSEVSPANHELLLLACKQADRAAECREILSKSGLTAVDRFGIEGPHWAIETERKASTSAAQLIKQVCAAVGKAEVQEAIEEDLFG